MDDENFTIEAEYKTLFPNKNKATNQSSNERQTEVVDELNSLYAVVKKGDNSTNDMADNSAGVVVENSAGISGNNMADCSGDILLDDSGTESAEGLYAIVQKVNKTTLDT